MPGGRKIEVDVVGNAAGFNKTMDGVTAKLNLLKSAGLGNVTKGLAIGAGVAGFNLLTTAVGTFVSQLDMMHDAFLADQESQLRLQNILQNTVKNYGEAVKQAEDFAGAQQRLGFEDDSVRDSLGQLVGITHDLAKAQELSSIAMDLSRAKNIDLAQATDTVARAYTGVARGLTLVGIDARGASTGLELVNRIAQNTKGAAETYAKSGAGRIAAANAKMQDTFEKVGQAIDKVSQIVIPIMAAGLGGIVDGIGEVLRVGADLAQWFDATFGPSIKRIGDTLAWFVGLLAQAAAFAGALAGAVASGLGIGGNGGGGSTGNFTGGTGVIDVSRGGSFNIGVPIHHTGGIVAGAPGSDQLIMAQAGERIIPNGGGNTAPTIIINIASFIGSDKDIDRFSDRLAFRLHAIGLG